MKLCDFVSAAAIIPALEATDRNGVIRELVNALAAAGRIAEADAAEIAKKVIQRENQGSMGLGKGVAVPHCKLESLEGVAAAIGLAPAGIDFSALDRAPVYIVFLVLSPQFHPEQHLAAMENIIRHVQRDNFRRFLRQAKSRQEIVDLLKEADEMPK